MFDVLVVGDEIRFCDGCTLTKKIIYLLFLTLVLIEKRKFKVVCTVTWLIS